MAALFRASGHTAIHTLDLPKQNRTSDSDIIDYAMTDDYIGVTKDADFVDAFYVRGKPQKLLLISTGNIGNRDLEALLVNHVATITVLFEEHSFIELSRTEIVIHI